MIVCSLCLGTGKVFHENPPRKDTPWSRCHCIAVVNQGLPDALRFCVVRETTNTYQITVYDPFGRILRENSGVPVSEIMDKLGFELEQLRSRTSEHNTRPHSNTPEK